VRHRWRWLSIVVFKSAEKSKRRVRGNDEMISAGLSRKVPHIFDRWVGLSLIARHKRPNSRLTPLPLPVGSPLAPRGQDMGVQSRLVFIESLARFSAPLRLAHGARGIATPLLGQPFRGKAQEKSPVPHAFVHDLPIHFDPEPRVVGVALLYQAHSVASVESPAPRVGPRLLSPRFPAAYQPRSPHSWERKGVSRIRLIGMNSTTGS